MHELYEGTKIQENCTSKSVKSVSTEFFQYPTCKLGNMFIWRMKRLLLLMEINWKVSKRNFYFILYTTWLFQVFCINIWTIFWTDLFDNTVRQPKSAGILLISVFRWFRYRNRDIFDVSKNGIGEIELKFHVVKPFRQLHHSQ